MKKEITLKNNEFIFTLFKGYYFKNIENLRPPIEMHNREYGIMTFDSRVIRHLSFSKLVNTPFRIWSEPNTTVVLIYFEKIS